MIVKIEFPFALDVDPAKVKKAVKAVAAEIAADSELSKDLLEPPKSQGIRRLENYSAIIGVKFMARPGEQFVLRREIYHRLLKAFDAAGLKLSAREIAFVHSPDSADQATHTPVPPKAANAKPGPVAAD